ncbi:histidine phosphatase family protein [Hyphomicrobium sp. CS1GBMeth3]|uniref:histidine phosphatase family protein n=1 Tax=Hyphomicrobium sp. CS1GBMeth3 TaxID=1892845 RepID=UPI000B149DFB|nr:histidine phosphatase family protein [Hyphomicrobium sp. CS1GBMeth3]
MTAVDFLRHGETDAGGVMLGRTDLPLSDMGRAAVERQIAQRRWVTIVSSPLARARETAAVAAVSGQVVEIDPAWREIDFGDWDGQRRDSLAQDPLFAAFYANPDEQAPPNGEPMREVRARITEALDRLAKRDGPVLVVTHGGAIRMALSVLLAIPLERVWAIRIACATRIRVELGAHPSHGLWGEIVEIVQPRTEGGS